MKIVKIIEPIIPENTIELFIKVIKIIIEILYEDFLYINNFTDQLFLSACGFFFFFLLVYYLKKKIK
jgi:hypothetical protein